MHAVPTHAKRPLALLVVMLLAVLGTGCAIRSGASARQAGIDYSDHHHYDRPHAPSPAYRTAADDAAARQLPWSAALQRHGVRDGGAAGLVGSALGYVSTALIAPPAAADAPVVAEAEGRGHRPSPVEAGRAPAPRPQGRGVLPPSALRRSLR